MNSRGLRKAIRTALQLIASGGLTALVTLWAGGLTPATSGLVLAGWAVLLTFIQNSLEANGTVPTLLPTPSTAGDHPPIVAPRDAI